MTERRRNPNQAELRKRRAAQEAEWNAQQQQTKRRNAERSESTQTRQDKRPGTKSSAGKSGNSKKNED
jgi:hypothetical protein